MARTFIRLRFRGRTTFTALWFERSAEQRHWYLAIPERLLRRTGFPFSTKHTVSPQPGRFHLDHNPPIEREVMEFPAQAMARHIRQRRNEFNQRIDIEAADHRFDRSDRRGRHRQRTEAEADDTIASSGSPAISPQTVTGSRCAAQLAAISPSTRRIGGDSGS